MLKLERGSRNWDLNIIVQHRERAINGPLLTAFAMAVGIHLLLFFTFQISPSSPKLNEKIYPPMIVQVDHAITSGAAVIAATMPTMQAKDHLPEIPLHTPELASIPSFGIVRYTENNRKKTAGLNPFAHLEKDIYAMVWKQPLAQRKNDIEIIISGPLSTYTLISKGLLDSLPLPKNETDYRVIYSVVADKTSGKIVWYQLHESSRNMHVDKFAEKVILSMRFARSEDGVPVKGQVEVHFHGNPKEADG